MLPPTPSSQPCRYPQEGSRLVAVCGPPPAQLTSNIFSMSLYLPFSSSPHEVRLQ